jgi:hypothetical protein
MLGMHNIPAFAICYSLGTICSLSSPLFLFGPVYQVKNMFKVSLPELALTPMSRRRCTAIIIKFCALSIHWNTVDSPSLSGHLRAENPNIRHNHHVGSHRTHAHRGTRLEKRYAVLIVRVHSMFGVHLVHSLLHPLCTVSIPNLPTRPLTWASTATLSRVCANALSIHTLSALALITVALTQLQADSLKLRCWNGGLLITRLLSKNSSPFLIGSMARSSIEAIRIEAGL